MKLKLSTTTKLPPTHPGRILKEHLMIPYGLNANRLGRMLDVPPNRIAQIINGKRDITSDTAMRLSRCFGISVEFWQNLQARYDREMAEDAQLPQRISETVVCVR